MFKEAQQPQEEHQVRVSKEIPRRPRRDTWRIIGRPKFLLGVGLALVLLALAGLAFPARGAPVEHEGAGRALVVNRMGLMETTFALGENDRFLYLPLLITWENLVNVARAQPVANAVAVAPTSAIAVEVNREVDTDTVNQQTFRLWGVQSGLYEGTFDFPTGNSWQFESGLPFRPGEVVRVQATGGIASRDGVSMTPYGWQFTAAAEGGTGNFVPHPDTPTFSEDTISDVVLGDLDVDGDLDAIVVFYNLDEKVWLNDGAGNFTFHPSLAPFAEHGGAGIALGDLDGDTDLDAVITDSYSGEGQQRPEGVWLNDGSGNFTPHPNTPSFGAHDNRAIALGDLDGDGDLDAVAAGYFFRERDTVWLNDGAGNFTPHPETPIFPWDTENGWGWSYDVELGDLDGDGDLDAVFANHNDYETVWLNDGAGNFTTRPDIPSFPGGGGDDPTTEIDGEGWSNDIGLGDLDGDGDLDAVVANENSEDDGDSESERPETVWLNDGEGNFTPHPDTPAFDGGTGRGLQLGDLDGDGDLDAVIANAFREGENQLLETVWLNDGKGNFTAHSDTPSFGAGYSEGLALGDLDGDGDLDAVVVNGMGPDVEPADHQGATVWLNSD